MATVKGSPRRYDSSGRQAQARQNRETVLDAAQRLFLHGGYAVTTIAAIARKAGVSVETIYKAFGGKAGLVRAIYERGLAGSGTVPAYERSDQLREHEVNPRAILRQWGALGAEVSAEVAPIGLLIRAAAASDSEMGALLRDSDAERLGRMRHNARFLADRGYLRRGMTVAEATDIMWTSSSPALFELLVMQRGWSLRRYGSLVADVLIATLLPEPG